MKIQYPQRLLASSMVAAMIAMVTISAPAFAETVSQEIVEAKQESQIWTTYALSPYLRANDLKVSVKSGKATITGRVEDSVNKDLAKQIALGVSGIKEVDNQIVVQADYVAPPATTTRSYGEVTDDAYITAAIKSKIMWSKQTDGLSATVDTNAGKVLLRGSAKTAESKAVAGRLAMTTRGVVAVDNQLIVGGTKLNAADTAKSAALDAERSISDSWITAKVKSTYLYSSNVAGSDINVKTQGGVVTLSGKVTSGAERSLAIELAKNVLGVKSVKAQSLTF
ncbi:BON domain-containing protein [Deefgea rivuli]|uniref:BON domain-containing protein n=1 Tax=Deefgea rivuli TaxID=400948 RepID=UPI000487C583|nr:BON domain-containing protein [Deefgea rivuli]